MDENSELTPRIGTFFVVIGLGLEVIFVASDFAGQVKFDYFFLGLIAIGIGWLFRRKKAPREPSGRFGWWRKMREKKKKKKD